MVVLAAGRHRHRLPGGDLGRLLDDAPGGAAGLSPAPADPPHLGGGARPDLRAQGQPVAAGRRWSRWCWASSPRTISAPPTASPSPAPCRSPPSWPSSTRWACASWNPAVAALLFGFFLTVDLAFFGANLLKIVEGGWFPLAVAAVVFIVMSTWMKGRDAAGAPARPRPPCRSDLFLKTLRPDHPAARARHRGVHDRQSRAGARRRCCTTSSTTRCCTSAWC